MIFCVQLHCGRDSVLLWRRCATLCTFGFMDDVTFGRNGRDAGRGWQHSASAINYVLTGAESDVYGSLFRFVVEQVDYDDDDEIAYFTVR